MKNPIHGGFPGRRYENKTSRTITSSVYNVYLYGGVQCCCSSVVVSINSYPTISYMFKRFDIAALASSF